MASLDGPTSLSLGQFYGPQSSINAATDGISQLGQTIARGPMIQAQGAALGAQTAHAQEQTRALVDDRARVQEAQFLMSDRRSLADPNVLARLFALGAASPTLQQTIAKNVGASYAAQGATRGGSVTPGAAESYNVNTGIVPAGQTFTGYNAGLQKDIRVAGIGAGATLGSARMAADASRYGADQRLTGEKYGVDNAPRLVDQGVDENGVPRPALNYSNQQVIAQHLPAHDATLANTIAGHTTTPVKVQGKDGATILMPSGQAEATGANVRPTSPTEAQGSVMQDVLTPPPGGGPSGITPEDKNAITDATVATLSGRPPPGQTSAAEAVAVDAMIEDRLRANTPTMLQDNKPAQSLLDPIRLQATWIRDHDKSVRGEWNAAVTKAVQNVTGQSGENVDTSFQAKGPSLLVLKPGSVKSIQWPSGMAVPPMYGGAAPTVAGTVSSPVPAPTPAPAPAPAPPGVVAPPSGPAAAPTPAPGPTVARALSTPPPDWRPKQANTGARPDAPTAEAVRAQAAQDEQARTEAQTRLKDAFRSYTPAERAARQQAARQKLYQRENPAPAPAAAPVVAAPPAAVPGLIQNAKAAIAAGADPATVIARMRSMGIDPALLTQ